jgi:pimeloyl-ACP methyl ester carboxylesterase
MGDPIRAVDRLDDLIARIGEHDAVVIVGHSLGGVLAQVFASRYPRRVRGMVLVDPTPGGFFDSLAVITGETAFAESQRRREASLQGAALEEWKRLGVALRAADSATAVNGRTVHILSAGRIENPDTAVGLRAKAVWLQLHERMANRLGGTQETVPEAGHYIQRFRPGVVVNAIRAAVKPPSRN